VPSARFWGISTLIYLSYQLHQDTRSLKLNAEFAAAQEHIHNSVGVSGTDVPYVMVRGMEDSSQLNVWEKPWIDLANN
jgi:hypothetical protein